MTKQKQFKKICSIIKEKKFDWVNGNITDDLFEMPKEIRSDYKLFRFDRFISSENAIKEMEKAGYSPSNAWELLNWKDWNNKDWVIALGSVGEVYGNRYVPCLGRGVSERDLGLSSFDGDWDAYCRFLGIRNSSLEFSNTHHSDLLPLEARVKNLEDDMEKIKKFLII